MREWETLLSTNRGNDAGCSENDILDDWRLVQSNLIAILSHCINDGKVENVDHEGIKKILTESGIDPKQVYEEEQ